MPKQKIISFLKTDFICQTNFFVYHQATISFVSKCNVVRVQVRAVYYSRWYIFFVLEWIIIFHVY
jgi:hypothetical protein